MTDYLQWQSNLTLEQVFASGESFSYPNYLGNGYLYLSNLKKESNRSVLMFKQDSSSDIPSICITPAPFQLRTKINEYGGKPYWVFGNTIYFSNQVDQRLYQQEFDFETGVISSPKVASPLVDNEGSFMFADIAELDSDWLVSVVEIPSDKNNAENRHVIQAIHRDLSELSNVLLVSGASFYSNLVISPDGTKAAWTQWDHPSMPWDDVELWIADIVIDGSQPTFLNQQKVSLCEINEKEVTSVCQLLFAANGRLFFSADFKSTSPTAPDNFWNVMCYDFDKSLVSTVTSVLSEFGYPHWQYGDARIVQYDKTYLMTYATSADGDQLYLINQDTLVVKQVNIEVNSAITLQNLSSDGQGNALAVMLSAKASSSLIELELQEYSALVNFNVLIQNHTEIDNKDISVAEHFEYPTKDDATAFGYYYPPVNSSYSNESPPPLIVMIHGGPTARAYGYFDIQKQFWTNRGFAVFDANPRGSTGYGRVYRDALYGQWGRVDIADIVDGVRHLIETDRAHPNQVCIRGKSSGGYAVLCALTEYPEIFCAGACYYGIGNLATLAEVTHKFEKFYTDRLIGEAYDSTASLKQSSLFYQRSPIHKVSQIKASMIIFQGLKDKIVPPSVALEMVSALDDRDLPYSYVEYPDEGHGFRTVENNIDAWTQELSFYQSILS